MKTVSLRGGLVLLLILISRIVAAAVIVVALTHGSVNLRCSVGSLCFPYAVTVTDVYFVSVMPLVLLQQLD